LVRLRHFPGPGLEALEDVGQDLELVLAALVGGAAGAALAAGAPARGQLLPPYQVAGAVPGAAGAGDPALELFQGEAADRIVAAVVIELHFPLVEQRGGLGAGDLHRSSLGRPVSFFDLWIAHPACARDDDPAGPAVNRSRGAATTCRGLSGPVCRRSRNPMARLMLPNPVPADSGENHDG